MSNGEKAALAGVIVLVVFGAIVALVSGTKGGLAAPPDRATMGSDRNELKNDCQVDDKLRRWLGGDVYGIDHVLTACGHDASAVDADAKIDASGCTIPFGSREGGDRRMTLKAPEKSRYLAVKPKGLCTLHWNPSVGGSMDSSHADWGCVGVPREGGTLTIPPNCRVTAFDEACPGACGE